jgi:iron complex outermembrane recepter protein
LFAGVVVPLLQVRNRLVMCCLCTGEILFAGNYYTPVCAATIAPKIEKKFDIAEGPLALQLEKFSRQANTNVLTAVDIHTKFGRRVVGLLRPEIALKQLVEGQKLAIEGVNGGYILRSVDAEKSAATGRLQPVADDWQTSELVVTGYRESLRNARDYKRHAVGAQDVILAEDIAAFPDLNLAESLQRIAGVAISRDAGEGRQISLRGLGPDFTRTQINGLEVLTNTSSGFDSRGSVSRTRSFDYSVFASELFDRITVEKGYSAEQDEGGIGGTIALRTAHPFDYAGFEAVLSAKALTNSNTKTIQPRLVGLVSQRWGDFGALVSAAYGANDVNEFGYRNWFWVPITVAPANVGAGIPRDVADRLSYAAGSDRIIAPQAETYSTWLDHRTRLGITASFQYDPGDRLQLGLDLIYGELHNDRDEYALAAVGNNGLTGNVGGTQRLDAVELRGNQIVRADWSGIDIRSEHKHSVDSTRFGQAVLNGSYRLGDSLTIKATAGYSRSEFSGPIFDKIFLQSVGRGFSYDLRGRAQGINRYGFDLADPAAWGLMRADTREDGIVSHYTTAKFDAAYVLGSNAVLKAGAAYKRFENSGFTRVQRVDYWNRPVVPAAVTTLLAAKTLAPYVVGDVEATFPLLGQNRDLTAANDQPGSDFRIDETTLAGYVQYDMEAELLGWPLRANAGLRYYSTLLRSTGFVQTGGTAQFVAITHRYNGVLPAFNIAVDLNDQLVARLGANRNISRPSLSDLRVAGNVNASSYSGSITAGNPDLTPFIADSIEASLELYQNRRSYLGLGLFYKHMKSFISTSTISVPYASTGYPLAFLQPGQDGSIIYAFNRPANRDGASIWGAELGLQRDFDFLPAPFDQFGVTGNVTFADGRSQTRIEGTAVALDLLQLSRWSSNATVYFETPRWGARVSLAYRSRYLDGPGGSGNIGTGFHGATNVDFAAHYNITHDLRIVVEGINLTDQPISQFADIEADRLLTTVRSGRSLTIGATLTFR